jgi:hypothetical protein
MLARRLLFALAVLLVLTAVAAALAPRPSAPQEDAAATPSPTAQPARPPVEETLDAEASGQKVSARVGQNVVIVVESDDLDSVSLAEVGTEPVEPESPARFELLADTPGSYAIDLLESGRRIGVLEIRE